MAIDTEKKSLSFLRDELLKYIDKLRLSEGDQIPTEGDLSQYFNVGRSSLREAVASLVYEGYLERTPGRGTFIRHLPLKLENNIQILRSVTEHIEEVGQKATTSRADVLFIQADKHMLDVLNVEIGEPLIRIERARRIGDDLAALSIDMFPASLFPDHKEEDFQNSSIFKLLHKQHIDFKHAETKIHPEILTHRDYPEIKTNSAQLFLLLEEIYFDLNGKKICYSNNYYNADIFTFQVIRKREENI
ncbi:MAG: GntR family transcriptional regulator [Alphaproteobacteria bacterium]